MPPRSMSVIVPAYNEETEIAAIVTALRDRLEARGAAWEIIVVDNASTDGTVPAVEPFLGDERIRLLRNDVNRGKGFSVRRGMLDARCELRLMCDADCAPSLPSLPELEVLLDRADVVAGLRNATDSRVSRRQPIGRRLVSKSFIQLCRAVMLEPLPDIFCGFKLFTAEAAVDVFSRVRIEGWVFDAEALALARALGYRVAGRGIVWINRPASRLSMPRVLVPALRELVGARAHIRRERRRASDAAASGSGLTSTVPRR